jgi:hypothetical protein
VNHVPPSSAIWVSFAQPRTNVAIVRWFAIVKQPSDRDTKLTTQCASAAASDGDFARCSVGALER